jgi:hypothetical protein
MSDSFNNGEIDTEEWHYTEARHEVLSFPKVGDSTVAWRLSFSIELLSEPEPSNEITAYMDTVFVRADRVAFSVIGLGVMRPLDQAILLDIARKAEAKIANTISGTVIPTPTATAINGDLERLKSFRWDMTYRGTGMTWADAGIPGLAGDETFTAQGAYIWPDQAQVTVGVDGGFSYGQTIKGQEQWTTVGGITSGPVLTTSNAMSLVFVKDFVEPLDSATQADMDCGEVQTVNGVKAIRCEGTEPQEPFDGPTSGMVEFTEVAVVVWVAEDGKYATRLEMNISGIREGEPFLMEMTINIYDMNRVTEIEP